MNRDVHPQNLSRPHFRRFLRGVSYLLAALLGCVLVLLAYSAHYERTHGGACASCHEIWQPYSDWHTSAHRGVPCAECHGDVFTLNAGFHINNMRRVFTHLCGEDPAKPRLRSKDVLEMMPRCRNCHEEEFADWQASAHSASYSDIFLNADHNHRQLLMDDCLCCHGMHFQGGIRDLVTPVSLHGPWRLRPAELQNRPAMPCLTCHEMHRSGRPMRKTDIAGRVPGPVQEIARPSLAFFERRSQRYVPLAELPMPEMLEGTRVVRMSKDQRQALCYQCHAPISTMQVGSGDDRTGMGVHEGISCLGCHAQHGQTTRASCASCHPKMSNCGLDVEKMDTTFKATASKHNIHWVKCVDCHTKGVPKKKLQPAD
jgi:Cytochrome c554 and c-prime